MNVAEWIRTRTDAQIMAFGHEIADSSPIVGPALRILLLLGPKTIRHEAAKIAEKFERPGARQPDTGTQEGELWRRLRMEAKKG